MLLLPLSTLWLRRGAAARATGTGASPRRHRGAGESGGGGADDPRGPAGGDPPSSATPRAAPGVLEETEEEAATGFGEGWAVILFNDDVHDMVEVVVAIHLATGFGEPQCIEIMLTAHRAGKAVVTITEREEAEKIASVLRTHKLTVELRTM